MAFRVLRKLFFLHLVVWALLLVPIRYVDGQDVEVPPIPDTPGIEPRTNADDSAQGQGFLTQDDLSSILSRLEELETGAMAFAEEESEIEFLESPSIDSLRVVNGRLHVDVWGFPQSDDGINLIESGSLANEPDDRILLRRIRFSVKGKVPPENVSYHLDLEFSGTDRGQVRDAWIGLDHLPFFNSLRFGNQKRPYGLDELNSSNFMVFLERPFVVSAFNEDNRRFGIASYGSSPDDFFNWRFGVFHLLPIQGSGSIVDDLGQLELAGRLAATPVYCDSGRQYLHLGLASSVAFPSDDPGTTAARFRTRPEARSGSRWLDTGTIPNARSYEILAAEAVANIGPWQFGGESMNLWLQRDGQENSSLFFYGGYVYASYFLTGEHMPWNRSLGILGRVDPNRDFICSSTNCQRGPGAWQIATRFSYADFNDETIFGAIGKSATIALNWYWNSHTRLQFNYIFGRVEDRQLDQIGNGPVQVSGDYQILGTRLMIDF